MKTKKIKKLTKKQVSKLKLDHKTKLLTCTTCDNKVRVDVDVIAVKCSTCTAKIVPGPKMIAKKKKSDKPAGWRFMAVFVDKEGNVYHTGVIQPKLKGTLPPSDVDKIRAEQKKKREENKKKKELRAKLKEERLIKQHEKAKKEKKKAKDKKAGKVTTKKTKKRKVTKAKNNTKKMRYEKFEEPRIATDRQQIENLIKSETEFANHLHKREIEVSSIFKINRSSYAAIDNSTGIVKNKRRGYKVTLNSGETKIININVKEI